MEAATAQPSIDYELDADLDAFAKTLGLTDEVTTITDIESRIDWLMEKIRDTTEDMEHNNEVAERRIFMIADWQQGENGKLDRRVNYLKSMVRQLVPIDAKEMKAVHGKGSRTLPHGKFGYRRSPDKVDIADMEKVLAFADVNHIECKTVRTVSKTDLKAHFKATGDPGDMEDTGWEVILGEDSFFLTVAK